MESSDWLVQECTIFALGAISSGCSFFMNEQMPAIYAYLLRILQNTGNPLLFSIASWSLCQYMEWLLESLSAEEINSLVDLMLKGMNQENRKVQLAAVVFFSSIVTSGEGKLGAEYFDAILQNACRCFEFYCEWNQRALLSLISDVCIVLVDSPVVDINQYASMLLPPIIAKWKLLDDLDEGMLAVLETLYYLISVCGNEMNK